MARGPLPPRPGRRGDPEDAFDALPEDEDGPATRRRDRSSSDDVDQLFAIMRRLEHRVEALEGRLTDVVASVREISNNSRPGMGSAPVERAVMRLSERMQRLEDLVGVDEEEGYNQRGLFGRLLGRD